MSISLNHPIIVKLVAQNVNQHACVISYDMSLFSIIFVIYGRMFSNSYYKVYIPYPGNVLALKLNINEVKKHKNKESSKKLMCKCNKEYYMYL